MKNFGKVGEVRAVVNSEREEGDGLTMASAVSSHFITIFAVSDCDWMYWFVR